MSKKPTNAIIKELIIVKKLVHNSTTLIKSDTLENNLIAIFNLNSALDIFLKIIRDQAKIKSVKQLYNISLEQQWYILSEAYKNRFGYELSMKTQIFTLNNIINDYVEHNSIPTNTQVHELCQALTVFIEELVLKIFNLDFTELDFHLLFDNQQVQHALKDAINAIREERYEEVLRKTSLAFHLAIEDQRQKLNYLSKKGLLKPTLLMMDKSIGIHFNPKDHNFIHLVLRTPPTKLVRFKQLVPTVLVSEDENNRPEIIVSDFVDEAAISEENAEFCLNFVLETILNWENLDLMRK